MLFWEEEEDAVGFGAQPARAIPTRVKIAAREERRGIRSHREQQGKNMAIAGGVVTCILLRLLDLKTDGPALNVPPSKD
jgi:hypothetical protein